MDMDRMIIEESVSILRTGGVNVAVAAGMSRLELGLVLHGLAGALIRGDVAAAPAASNGNGNGASQLVAADRFVGLVTEKPQSPQGSDRKTVGDRRGLPRKRVVSRTKRGKREELECGHAIEPVPSNWKKHRSRACEQCAAEAITS